MDEQEYKDKCRVHAIILVLNMQMMASPCTPNLMLPLDDVSGESGTESDKAGTAAARMTFLQLVQVHHLSLVLEALECLAKGLA